MFGNILSSLSVTRVNLMGSSKNVNDTAPTNYASNYDIDEELNLIGNDDLLAARAKLDVTRDVEHIAHFLHINKDDLDKKHERPYNRENTASRSICEVKHVLVWIVVRWGTTREVQMLFFFNFLPAFFSLFLFSLSFLCLYLQYYTVRNTPLGVVKN